MMGRGEQDVAWEHRITALETAVTAGFDGLKSEIQGLRIDLVGRVNRTEERVYALELWRAMRTEEIAHQKGLSEGRQGLRKSEMAGMAAALTAGGVIAGIIPHIWSLIR